MTITAVRLRSRDKNRGFLLRTYVTYTTGTKYSAGDEFSPPTWRITDNQSEIEELRDIKQFEISNFADRDSLEKAVQSEMEENARKGLPPVRAKIEDPKSQIQERDLSVLSRKSSDSDEGDEKIERRPKRRKRTPKK